MITKILARLLKRLRGQGAIPASALSDTHRQTLRSLFDADVLVEVRKGRGHSVEVHNWDAFTQFLSTHCPEGLDAINSAMSRSEAVAALRNSKQGRLVSEAVILSARSGRVLVRSDDQLKVGDLTELAQVASFLLEERARNYWQFEGRIALVENYACFVHWHAMGIEADLAIWTAGRISDRMIRWFASWAMKGTDFLHCGDYDPVGLSEFLRLKDQLPDGRVTLHIPVGIETLFERYSNRNLLANANAAGLLKRLRVSDVPDVRRIVGLMDRNNGGLEQEILVTL
jgi:hypothetical protein